MSLGTARNWKQFPSESVATRAAQETAEHMRRTLVKGVPDCRAEVSANTLPPLLCTYDIRVDKLI